MEQTSRYYEAESMFHGSIPHAMGSRFDALLFTPRREVVEGLWGEIPALIEELDSRLNRFSPTSEVSHINHAEVGQIQPLSEEVERLLQLGEAYYRQTEGLFDITLGGLDALTFGEGAICRHRTDVMLDFGGIAKGYVLREVKQRLQAVGIGQAFVDFGGSSILGLGNHPYGEGWQVELTSPYDGRLLERFTLKDESLSTSGNTPTYHGHICHPKRGERCEDRRVVAVKSPDPLDAEVLSTAWMIASEQEQQQMRKHFGSVEPIIYNL